MIDRRSFLKYAGLAPLIGATSRLALAADEITAEKADYTLRIDTGLVELAPDHSISTTLGWIFLEKQNAAAAVA
jgi:hypothetical protein